MRLQRLVLTCLLALSLGAQAREERDPGHERPQRASMGGGGVPEAPASAPSARKRRRAPAISTPAAPAPRQQRYHDIGIHRVPQRNEARPALRERPERSHIDFPHEGGALRHPHARPFERRAISSVTVHNHFREVLTDRGFLADMRVMHREERVAGRYYWHRWQDLDYCHYYDRWGYHWYGWYLGPRFLWVRSFGGRFWWYDESATRWCFWFNGDWWWPDPIRETVYVYRDGDYIANEPGPAVASTPIPAPPGEAAVAPNTSPAAAPYIDPKDVPPAPEELPPLPDPQKL